MKLTELTTYFPFTRDNKKKSEPVLPEKETAEQILKRVIAQETANLNFKIKRREARAKYYDLSVGITNPLETRRLTKIFTEQEFSYSVTPENEITDLNWETKEQDFAAFDILVQRIRETVHLSDEEFRVEIYTIIYELVSNSPLYSRLNNDSIPRSAAHIDNPLQHTIAVAQNIITTGLDPFKIFWARLSAIEHDLLKLGIAIGDHTNVHAEGSKEIWKEYYKHHPLKEFNVEDEKIRKKLIDQFLIPVRYHHLPEIVQYDIMSDEEAFSLIMYDPFSLEEHTYLEERQFSNLDLQIPEPADCLFMLGVLSSADAASVDRYIPYAIANVTRYYAKIFSQLEFIDWNKYPKQYFQVVSEWLYQMFVVATSENPATLLAVMRNLKDPLIQDKDFRYEEKQLAQAKEGYFQYARFDKEHGINRINNYV